MESYFYIWKTNQQSIMKKIFFGVLCSTALISCTLKQISLDDLQGIWAPAKGENAAFTIQGNAITYFEQETALNIKLKDSTLELLEEGHHISYWKIQKVTKDTLILATGDHEIVKFVKIPD
jgi:hypothetical protein